jgi:IclR family acetate operon transcriptional repressor
LYANQPLVLRTGQGPSTIDELLRDLDKVRAAGYALDREMVTPGITCSAAAVFSHEGVPAAAIGVTFVTAQRGDAEVEGVTALVRDTAARLSASLGYNPATAPAAHAQAATG